MSGCVRAVIIQAGKVVLIRRTKKDQPVYYSFPGGHIEDSDADAGSALVRECQEELGIVVQVNNEVYRQEFNGMPDVFYACDIISGQVRDTIGGPEAERQETYGSYEIVWVDLKDVSMFNIQPADMKAVLQ